MSVFTIAEDRAGWALDALEAHDRVSDEAGDEPLDQRVAYLMADLFYLVSLRVPGGPDRHKRVVEHAWGLFLEERRRRIGHRPPQPLGTTTREPVQ